MNIETGDTVYHRPSGQTWTVAYARDGILVPCGWPLSVADLVDCELISKSAPGKRLELLGEMAAIKDDADPRKSFGQWALQNLEQ